MVRSHPPLQETGAGSSLASTLCRAWDIAFAAAVLGAGLVFAKLLLAVSFSKWDDEGYVLISLLGYVKGGRLYSEVFSQYGPVFFHLGDLLFGVLKIPLNHDGGRAVTLVAWLAAALLGGWTVYRLTRHAPLATAACGAMIAAADVLANEPLHPQFLILVSTTAALGVASLRGGRWGAAALGALAAAILLTKVNVGLLFGIALLQTIVTLLPDGGRRKLGLAIVGVTAGLLPLLLMRAHIGAHRRFFVLSTVCLIAVAFAGGRLNLRLRPSGWSLLPLAAGAAGSLGLMIGIALLRGSSFADLVNGIFLWPMRQAAIYSVPYYPSNIASGCALLLSAVSAAAAGWLVCTPLERHRDKAGMLCFFAGLLAIVLVLLNQLAPAMALLPIGAVALRLDERAGSGLAARLLLMNWSAMSYLQIYPVAGSQAGIAGMPVLLWGFTCLADGLGSVAEWLGSFRIPPALASRAVASMTVIFAASAAIAGSPEFAGALRGTPYPPSKLHGAHSLRLEPSTEVRFQLLVQSVRRNCDTLFTLPGMASFNVWSNVPPPTGWNMTAWMKAFDRDRQQQILDVLKTRHSACVIQNSNLIRFWQLDLEEVRGLPLGRYVLDHMPAVEERDGYVIRMHPERNSPWISPTS